MATRIALVPCINPAHADSTPSMAVYDHGKSKLQVFCFGCKYHGWVTPSAILTGTHRPTRGECGELPVQGEYISPELVQDKVEKFFMERNIEHIPWGHITYGCENFTGVLRPYMVYALYDLDSNTIGRQYRFLDTLKPKVKTVASGGRYPAYAWWRPELIESTGSAIRVVESWVDAVFLDQCLPGAKPVLILLGTNYNKVDWYRIQTEVVKQHSISLWFDGDKAGKECADKLYHLLSYIGCMVDNNTTEGLKVYEHRTL